MSIERFETETEWASTERRTGGFWFSNVNAMLYLYHRLLHYIALQLSQSKQGRLGAGSDTKLLLALVLESQLCSACPPPAHRTLAMSSSRLEILNDGGKSQSSYNLVPSSPTLSSTC